MELKSLPIMIFLVASALPAAPSAKEGLGGYLTEFCRQKAASMELALMYYKQYKGDRRKVRYELFSLWQEKNYDPRLQSNFINDIDGFLDVVDEKMVENPIITYNMINNTRSIDLISNETYQSCIIKAGK